MEPDGIGIEAVIAGLVAGGSGLVRPAHTEALAAYSSMLYEASGHLNLIAEGDRESLAIRHVLPSLTMGAALASVPHQDILDFGSGAGLPGIPLKILFPHSRFVLVESRRRRANFLRDVIRRLQLKRIEVRNCRIESLYNELAEGMDIVVSRAAMEPEGLWQCVAPVTKAHGVAIVTLGESRGIGEGRPIIFRKSSNMLGRTTCVAVLR